MFTFLRLFLLIFIIFSIFFGEFIFRWDNNYAFAQSFNPRVPYSEGRGLKLSDTFVFHGGLALEGRYDTNVLNVDRNIKGAPYLWILPHLHLATLSPQRLTDGEGKVAPQKASFRLKLAGGFREYLTSQALIRSQRAIELLTGLEFIALPNNPFSFYISDDFARTVSAQNAETVNQYSRDTNRASAGFKIIPGGGRLAFDLGYAFVLDCFEETALAGSNRYVNEAKLNTSWRLLPKTALALDILQQFSSYYDKDKGTYGVRKIDCKPFRVNLGLIGLFTPRLSTILKIGYGNSFHADSRSYNNVLGRAELSYALGPFGKLRGGYEHLFDEALTSNYFTDEKIFMSYDHLVASRFLLHAKADYRYRRYSGLSMLTGAVMNTEEKQHVLTAGAGIDFQILDWLYTGVGYDIFISKRIGTTTVANQPVIPSYTKHQVFGKVGINY